jgi:hypothetical protein
MTSMNLPVQMSMQGAWDYAYVVLVGAVVGVHAAIGGNDLAEGVVAPGPGGCGREGGAAGGDCGALADGVHGVVILGNDGAANFVLLGGEDVAGGFPGVGDGVDGSGGGGDGFDEVAVGEVAVGEGGGAVGDGLETAVGG